MLEGASWALWCQSNSQKEETSLARQLNGRGFLCLLVTPLEPQANHHVHTAFMWAPGIQSLLLTLVFPVLLPATPTDPCPLLLGYASWRHYPYTPRYPSSETQQTMDFPDTVHTRLQAGWGWVVRFRPRDKHLFPVSSIRTFFHCLKFLF